MNTLGNGVKLPTGLDLVDPQALLAALANSFSDAIGGLGTGKRQPRRFRVANQVEKNGLAALTTLVEGDEVYLEDSQWWEIRRNNAWTIWRTLKPVPWPLAHTGINVQNGIDSFAYMVTGDLIHLQGALQIGSSTTVAGGSLILPFAQPGGNNTRLLGNCSKTNYSASTGVTGAEYLGVVRSSSTTAATLLFNTGATTGVLTALAANVPISWSAGDFLGLDLRYRRAV